MTKEMTFTEMTQLSQVLVAISDKELVSTFFRRFHLNDRKMSNPQLVLKSKPTQYLVFHWEILPLWSTGTLHAVA
jgi:hypothetical protein